MMNLYFDVSNLCSKITTQTYSTSFSYAIKLLHRDLRVPIYNIYGFVRLADEIVDTFHDHDQKSLLQQFKNETYSAIKNGISLNPILQSFQTIVNQYNIEEHLIDAFFSSMELDLYKLEYNKATYNEYIYGSAEVVGLMCLTVFCEGDRDLYLNLKPYAQSLGAAFQKVNFLRDLKADNDVLNRMYFPGCNFLDFTEEDKKQIEADIQNDFKQAFQGIMQLPVKARFGVYVAYLYYMQLLKKIKNIKARQIMEERIRIPNYLKAFIIAKAGLRRQLNIM